MTRVPAVPALVDRWNRRPGRRVGVDRDVDVGWYQRHIEQRHGAPRDDEEEEP